MEITYFNGDVVLILDALARLLLEYIGGFALLFLVLSGVFYMLAEGDPARQTKAKMAMTYALMGLLIVLLSYAAMEAIARLVN